MVLWVASGLPGWSMTQLDALGHAWTYWCYCPLPARSDFRTQRAARRRPPGKYRHLVWRLYEGGTDGLCMKNLMQSTGWVPRFWFLENRGACAYHYSKFSYSTGPCTVYANVLKIKASKIALNFISWDPILTDAGFFAAPLNRIFRAYVCTGVISGGSTFINFNPVDFQIRYSYYLDTI